MSENAEHITLPGLMTKKEVAKYLGVHLSTVDRLIADKTLPAVKFRRQIRIREDELQTFLNLNSTAGSSK